MRVTLNISSRDIRLVAATERKIIKWQTVPLEPGMVKDGHILQPQAVAKIIDNLFKSLKLPRDNVIACVDGLSFTYRTLILPRLKPSRLQEAIERAARKEIPLPLEELYLEWLVVNTTSDEIEVFVLGVPRSLLDTVVQTLKTAKVELTAFGFKSLALARAAGKANAVIVDFEPECFDIVIVSEGVPAIMHTVTPRGEKSSLEDNVHRLADELNRTIDFFNITHSKNPIGNDTPLWLSGSLFADESVSQLIRNNTGHPTEMLKVQIPLPNDFPMAFYTSNIGLMLKMPARQTPAKRGPDSYHDYNPDLLNARRRALARHVSPRSYLAPAMLIIFFLLLVPAYWLDRDAGVQTVSSQSEMERLNRNLHLARLRADETAQTEAKIQQLLAAVNTLDAERATFSGDAGLAGDLRSVINALPLQAYAVNIDTSPEQLTIAGWAAKRSDVISYAFALEKSGLFAGVRIALIDEKTDETGAYEGVVFTIIVER